MGEPPLLFTERGEYMVMTKVRPAYLQDWAQHRDNTFLKRALQLEAETMRRSTPPARCFREILALVKLRRLVSGVPDCPKGTFIAVEFNF